MSLLKKEYVDSILPAIDKFLKSKMFVIRDDDGDGGILTIRYRIWYNDFTWTDSEAGYILDGVHHLEHADVNGRNLEEVYLDYYSGSIWEDIIRNFRFFDIDGENECRTHLVLPSGKRVD